MDGDKLDFLDEQEPETEAEVKTEAEETEQVEGEAETPEPKAEDVPEPEPTGDEDSTPPVEEPKGREVPITAMLDEREKRQKAEREAEEARKTAEAVRRQLEAMKAQKEPENAPDFYENPDERLQFEARRIEQGFQARTLQQSRFFAERDHGAELVNEAMSFFDQNPQLSHQFMEHPSPFHAAIDFYKQQKFLTEVSDPDKWREQERQRIREEVMAEMKPQPSKPKAPPASLASAPAAGTDAIVPGNAFDGVFGE